VLPALVCACAAAAQIEVAAKLAVDVHAELMVAVDEQGHALNWYNCGSLWGTFGDFGFDGPRARYPKLGKVDGAEALISDGDGLLRLDMKAPDSITSDGDFSVEVWARNPSVQPDECLVVIEAEHFHHKTAAPDGHTSGSLTRARKATAARQPWCPRRTMGRTT
jgi:hypothetical protein